MIRWCLDIDTYLAYRYVLIRRSQFYSRERCGVCLGWRACPRWNRLFFFFFSLFLVLLVASLRGRGRPRCGSILPQARDFLFFPSLVFPCCSHFFFGALCFPFCFLFFPLFFFLTCYILFFFFSKCTVVVPVL